MQREQWHLPDNRRTAAIAGYFLPLSSRAPDPVATVRGSRLSEANLWAFQPIGPRSISLDHLS